MSVVITKEDLIAYAEVDYIIKHMNKKYIEKLPENLLVFFDTIKDPNYEVYVDPYRPLEKQGLQKYALEIIALLHIKYWCENKERKEELLEKMKENQEKFEAQLREKFSTENLFNNQEANSDPKVGRDPVITAYSNYTEENPDIQDYTDIQEKQAESEEVEGNEMIQEKKSIFGSIKKFISKIFGKKS